jgi:diphthamide biosynthesis protein 7
MARGMLVLAQQEVARSADCCEAWPGGGGLVAFASYELEALEAAGGSSARAGGPAAAQRVGEVVLARWEPRELALRVLHRDRTSGVFDIKWSGDGAACLAVACADGRVALRRGAEADPRWVSAAVAAGAGDGDGAAPFCLSLDWDNRASRASAGAARLAVSRSDGRLSLLAVREAAMELELEWDAHALGDGVSPAEVWIAAFDPFEPALLVSGADDGKMKTWDLRCGPVAVATSRVHGAGVTSLQFSLHRAHEFASGSYDSCVRLWDRRAPRAPLCKELDLGGGIWRLKWHPARPHALLVAAMRSGFQVLDTSAASAEAPPTVLAAFAAGHHAGRWEALGYGADWLDPDSALIASASFYDRTLRILDPGELEIPAVAASS